MDTETFINLDEIEMLIYKSNPEELEKWASVNLQTNKLLNQKNVLKNLQTIHDIGMKVNSFAELMAALKCKYEPTIACLYNLIGKNYINLFKHTIEDIDRRWYEIVYLEHDIPNYYLIFIWILEFGSNEILDYWLKNRLYMPNFEDVIDMLTGYLPYRQEPLSLVLRLNSYYNDHNNMIVDKYLEKVLTIKDKEILKMLYSELSDYYVSIGANKEDLYNESAMIAVSLDNIDAVVFLDILGSSNKYDVIVSAVSFGYFEIAYTILHQHSDDLTYEQIKQIIDDVVHRFAYEGYQPGFILREGDYRKLISDYLVENWEKEYILSEASMPYSEDEYEDYDY